jgi:hypothetical protein
MACVTRSAWTGKSASLVTIYGFLAANAWLPAPAAAARADAQELAERADSSSSSSGSGTFRGKSAAGAGGAGVAGAGAGAASLEDTMVARLEMGVSWQAMQLLEYDRPFPIYTAVAVKEGEPDAQAGELGGGDVKPIRLTYIYI